MRRAILAIAARALGLALVLSLVAPAQPAEAAGRCSTMAGNVEQRIAEFWQCVASLGSSDLLTAEDLGQWARNVIERDPEAGIRVVDFRGATLKMQGALDLASAGVPPAPPKAADVEDRIALFWQKVNALTSCQTLSATDLGQWALNVIDRDPSKRIRVSDFRTATAGMQGALDRVGDFCTQPSTPGVTCPSAATKYAICGRVTRADTGAPVAGAEVSVDFALDPKGSAITGADGTYTVSLAQANPYYIAEVLADPSTGLGSILYGGSICREDPKFVRTTGHTTGVDFALPKGHWLNKRAVDVAGRTVTDHTKAAVYLARTGRWCDAQHSGSYRIEPDGTRSEFYAAGTYRIVFDPRFSSDQGSLPVRWYPSAPTANTAADVVLDRDLSGITVTVPTAHRISGRMQVSEADEVELVMLDGGKVGVVSTIYPDGDGAFTFAAAPGTYRVRAIGGYEPGSAAHAYYPSLGSTFESGGDVVVTNADVTGIDIIE